METNMPARKGCHARRGWGPGGTLTAGASRALGKSCSLTGEGRGRRRGCPKGVGRGPACQPQRGCWGVSPPGEGLAMCITWGVRL